MSARQFERMAEQVAALRPELDAAGVQHACNLISNAIRRIKTDTYDMQLTAEQLPAAPGYYQDHAVEVRGQALWLRVWVD